MSLLKYHDELHNGNVSLNRAHLDRVPWRGPTYPLKEEEYYEYTGEVLDFDVGIFDIRNADERVQLKAVMDRAANGWFRIIDYDKKWVTKESGEQTMLVYVAWAEPYRQLDQSRVRAELSPTPIPAAMPTQTFR